MEKQIPWDIILESIQDKTGKEDIRLEKWFSESKGNQQLFDELKVIYKINGAVPEYYIPDQKKGWQNIKSRISKSIRKDKFIHYFTRVAASILLFALGAGVFRIIDQNLKESHFTEVLSTYGHKIMILLPDSSVVWLNGESKLRYNTDFSKERSLELEGEALFEVRKDQGKLFSVKSKTIRVEVYGTKFNFRTYRNDNEVEVALLEGSVGIFKNQQFMRTMAPGEVTTYIPVENKLLTSKRNDLGYITSWQSDELVIDNMPVAEIFKYLERWYGIQIEYDTQLDTGQKLSFKVKTESLRELLSIINRVIPLNYAIDGKKVVITKL